MRAVQPRHVASWIELQMQTLSALTVKQRLAAVRHLFDLLVTGQVVFVNPVASVRGPNLTVRTGKTRARGGRGAAAAGQHRRLDARRACAIGQPKPYLGLSLLPEKSHSEVRLNLRQLLN